MVISWWFSMDLMSLMSMSSWGWLYWALHILMIVIINYKILGRLSRPQPTTSPGRWWWMYTVNYPKMAQHFRLYSEIWSFSQFVSMITTYQVSPEPWKPGMMVTVCDCMTVTVSKWPPFRWIMIIYPDLVGGLFFLFFHILGIIIPIDFHVFQRGRYTTGPPTSDNLSRSMLLKILLMAAKSCAGR